jgi:outer membrane protein assembly factor BamB
MAASPILVKDKLIVPMDNAGESFLAAIDTRYGKNVWKAERKREINWVTPITREAGGKTEVLFAGIDGLTAYDATTGDKRWNFRGGAGSIPTGVIDSDALYLPVGGVSRFKISDSGTTEKPDWAEKQLSPGMSSPLVYSGRVYTATGGGLINAADTRTGKVLFKERVKGVFNASPIAGDGKVYCFNETGACTVFKAGTDEFDLLAVNDIGEEILGTPAISGGLIFIRTDKHLFGIGK